MDKLQDAYITASEYPKSIIGDQSYPHEIATWEKTLNDSHRKLFSEERNAEVDFWQLEYDGGGSCLL